MRSLDITNFSDFFLDLKAVKSLLEDSEQECGIKSVIKEDFSSNNVQNGCAREHVV